MLMDSVHDPMLSGLSIFPTWKEEEDCDNVSKDYTQKNRSTFKRYAFPTWAGPAGHVIKLYQSIHHWDQGPLANLLIFVGKALSTGA